MIRNSHSGFQKWLNKFTEVFQGEVPAVLPPIRSVGLAPEVDEN